MAHLARRVALVKRLMQAAFAAWILVMSTPSTGGDEDAPTNPLHWSMDSAAEERILALHADDLSADDVRVLGQLAGAPRIIAIQGSVPLITMQPFAEFLIAMGYPEADLRDSRNGQLSQSSFADSDEIAGKVAWYYEHDGMLPMLIGHSQGGMLAMRVLYVLAGAFGASVPVWDPRRDAPETRTTIVDPRSGQRRPVVGLMLPYVATLATGKLPRLLLGQWSMLSKLRKVPDSVEEFSGFTFEWDPIAGSFPGSERYAPLGSAKVRNVTLPETASHVTLPEVRELAADPVARVWIEDYR